MSTSHSIHLGFIFILYHTYFLSNCKGHIQMTSNYSKLMCKKKTIDKNKNLKITFNTLRNYFILFHTYILLNCKGHIQMTSNNSTIDV